MPARRKIVTTEEYSKETPTEQDSKDYPDEDAFDYMSKIAQEERTNTKIYVDQIEPSVTRAQGQAAYLEVFSGEVPPTYSDLRRLSPYGSRFRIRIYQPKKQPKFFTNVALVPQSQVTATAAIGTPGSSPELVALLKEMIDKSNSGVGIDQLKESFTHIQEMQRGAFTESLKTIAQQKPEGEAGLIDKLVKLGVIKTGGQGGILETVGVLKQLGLIGEKREDVFDQIEKLKTMGELLGWSTGAHGGGDEDWRISLAKNAPDILSGIEKVTLNIVQAIQQARAPQGAPPPTAPGDAQKPALAAQQPEPIPASVMQAALDSLVKSKLIQFYKEEIEADEIVAWLDLTAPEMVDYLKKFDAEQVHAFFKTDAILNQIAGEDKCKPWLEKVLTEMKAEPVEV